MNFRKSTAGHSENATIVAKDDRFIVALQWQNLSQFTNKQVMVHVLKEL